MTVGKIVTVGQAEREIASQLTELREQLDRLDWDSISDAKLHEIADEFNAIAHSRTTLRAAVADGGKIIDTDLGYFALIDL